jgi:dTDP-4-dehydrorhamnose reductase
MSLNQGSPMTDAPLGMPEDTTRILVLGASGMLGHALLATLSGSPDLAVRGHVRSAHSLPEAWRRRFAGIVEVGDDLFDGLGRAVLLERTRPDVVINAVGVIKQDASISDTASTVRVNALLPHLLADDCSSRGIRLIHVSTDCVFSGRRGNYSEADIPDPADFYGRSKLLGELEAPALTLRTSIIGHELRRHSSLIDWFLAQPAVSVPGYVHAIYSGVTTLELSRLIRTVVLPDPGLVGLHHVASRPISKFELLKLVAEVYGWQGSVEPYEQFKCDRSLSSERFADATGYRTPTWREMVTAMHESRTDLMLSNQHVERRG